MDTARTDDDVSTASDYQWKVGHRAACLGFIIIVVVAVVLLVFPMFSRRPIPD